MKFIFFFGVCLSALAGSPSQRSVDGDVVIFNPEVPLLFHVESGDLAPAFSNELVRTWVGEAFATWTNLEGSRLTVQEGPQLSADVTSLQEILVLLTMGLNPVVFDEDGSILASVGFDPAKEGIALQFDFDGQHYEQLVIVISGPALAAKSESEVRHTLLHFTGRALGLGASVINGDLFSQHDENHPLGIPPITTVEVLYPLNPSTGKSPLLKQGDISDFLALYGQSNHGRSGFGTIEGTIFDASGKPSGGINVIVRNRADGGIHRFTQAAATISNPLNGTYRIVGLPPGEYSVEVSDAAVRNGAVFGDPIKTDAPAITETYFNVDSSRPEITGKFPGPEEYYNGENESHDPYQDDPAAWQTVTITANSTTSGIDVMFNHRKETLTRLLYPWISNRAGSFESVLIANNFGNTSVNVQLTATRSATETERVTRTIPAGGFLREAASSLFPQLGSGGGYSVLLTAPSRQLRGSWVTNSLEATSGQSPSQGVAVEIPLDENDINERISHRALFGYLPLDDALISAPVVVNTGSQPADIHLRFYDPSGAQVATTTLTQVPPWVPFASVANALVPEGPTAVMMVAESSARITGVSFVFNHVFFETAIANAAGLAPQTQEQGATTLVFPWISKNAGIFESIVIANNLSDTPITVTLTARRNDPSQQSQTVMRTIPAYGFLQERAATLFDNLGSGPGYSVTLDSPTSRVSGQWVTNNLLADSGLSPSQGLAVVKPTANTAPQVRAGKSMMLGYLPLNDAFTSAPVLVNLGEDPTDITLSFFRENGELVLRDSTTLQGLVTHLPAATLANALVPENSGDVYLIAESASTPITGVVFVFNTEFFEPAIGNGAAVEPTPPRKTAFVNVNVIPMDENRVLPAMTVLVADDTIVAMGPVDDTEVPPEAVQIDGRGLYLMPGLNDAHMHVYEPGDFILYLANGVTTGLSMGDSGYEINGWREEILGGERHGPSLYAGNFFRGVPDDGEPQLTVATPAQGRAHVIHTKNLGYDFIKVYSGLSTEVFNAIMDEASIQGMPVIGHVPREPGLAATLDAGVAMIAHAEEYWSSIFGFTISQGLVPSAVSMTRNSGAYVTATLAVVEALPVFLGQNTAGFQDMLQRPGVAYMDPKRVEAWQFDFLTETADPGIAGARLPFMRDYTKALYDGGVPLLLGSDATLVGMVPGYAVHLELESLARIGLTPYQVLETATRNFGTFINGQLPHTQPFGMVKVGHRADLLLLEANPLTDLKHANQRIGVMARGIWYSEAQLQQMLEDLKASYENR